jgi:hypothetical protein
MISVSLQMPPLSEGQTLFSKLNQLLSDARLAGRIDKPERPANDESAATMEHLLASAASCDWFATSKVFSPSDHEQERN